MFTQMHIIMVIISKLILLTCLAHYGNIALTCCKIKTLTDLEKFCCLMVVYVACGACINVHMHLNVFICYVENEISVEYTLN